MDEAFLLAGRYQVIEKISHGMMGPVYRGRDLETGEPVAVKTLDPEMLRKEPTLLERFRREGEALRQLDHPGIVHRLDVVESERGHFLIMEYVTGGSLYELLQSKPQLPVREVLEIGLDLADALARAHRLGIIHRDLKPQNVLLSTDGTPRLSDFGIAHFFQRTTISQPGGFAGTLSYVPPESFLGQEVDERVDIWGFGVMLFEMLGGRRPFEARTTAELINSILTKPPADLRQLRTDLPRDLYDLIDLMLVKDPAGRIPSIRQVGAALEAIHKGRDANLPSGPEMSRPARTPHNIPEQLMPFIGREREILEVANLLQGHDCRLLTLTGPGGVGKSRLAVQAARQMLGRYPGGIFFVDLGPVLAPELVISRIARVIGIKEAPSRSLAEDVTDQLRGKSSLLLLDNFEQVIGAAPTVSQLISAVPELDIMVTSREALRLYGEHEYPVPPLSTPDLARRHSFESLSRYEAVALFVDRATTASPTFVLDEANVRDVAEICVRLDGLPLAIELAAARIRIFSPRYLLSRLSDALGTLTAGPRDLAARHQALRTAIDWSYQLLTDDEKQLFERLSVFQGGRSPAAVEAICGPGLDINVWDGLESLYRKSLLFQEEGLGGEPRFTMLETIQQFARSRLVESGQAEELQRSHAEYFAALAEEAEGELRGPGQELWSARLRLEYDNLRAALAWSLDGGDKTIGLRLAAALCEFWYYEGPISDGERWMDQAVNWVDVVGPSIQAKVMNAASTLAYARSDHEQGKIWSSEALAIARRTGDKTNWAWALFWLSAHGTANPEDYEEALRQCEQAVALFKELGDEPGLAWSYNGVGELSRLLGNLERAGEAYAASVAICRRAGNKRREAIALVNLSYVAQHQGDFMRAEELALSGLALLRELKLEYHTAIVLAMLSGPVAAQGRARQAARLLGASESTLERMSLSLPPADAVEISGYISMVRDRLDQQAFEMAWGEGLAMSTEQAIVYALSRRPADSDLVGGRTVEVHDSS